MPAGDDDWPAVAGNLAKARRSWGRLQRILGREGARVPMRWWNQTDIIWEPEK